MRVFVIARKITTTITRADGVAALNTLDTALTTEFSDGGDHGVGATTVYTQWEAKDSDDYLSAVVVCAQTDVPTVIATFRGTIQAGLEAQATISAVALTDIAFLAQSDTDEMNHEFLAGLLGGASSDHQHLTTAALASVSALGSASALTAGTGVGEVPVSEEVPEIIGAITTDPSGWPDRSEATMAWSNGDRKLTITAVGASYRIYVHGVLFTIASDDVTITDTEGWWYIYYTSAGVLTASQVFPNAIWADIAWVAYAYWDATGGTAVIGPTEERHGTGMASDTHLRMHFSVGTTYESGLGATGNVVGGAPGDDTSSRVYLEGGAIADEDLRVAVVNDSTPTDDFEQDLGTGLLAGTAAKLPVLYLDGAAGNLRSYGPDANRFAFKPGGTFPQWNEYAGGTWGLSEPASGERIIYWICIDNDPTTPVFLMMGQGSYSTLAEAQAVTPADILWGNAPFQEILIAHRVIIRVRNNYNSATHKAKTEAIDDFRAVANGPVRSAAAQIHSGLAGLGFDASGHAGFQRETFQSAATDPTANWDEDNTAAVTGALSFRAGDFVLNQTTEELWRCRDASSGAAVWEVIARQPYSSAAAPTADNDSVDTAALGRRFHAGDVWVRTVGPAVYVCAAATATAADWNQIDAAAGGGDFSDGGDAGGAARSIGNTDAYSLSLLTRGYSRLRALASGLASGLVRAAVGLVVDSEVVRSALDAVVTNARAHGVAVRHMGPGPAGYIGKADTSTNYNAVHADGNFAFLGCAAGLLSYSYTPAGALTLIDTEVAPGIVTSITSAGEYIVAGDSAGDIWVFTVDAAGALTQVGGATGGAGVVEGLCWDGKHLFAARMATGVISYTLSEAGALAVVDTYNPTGNCYDVLMLENGVLCIAGDTGGMYTVTVSEVGVMTAADSDSFGVNSARGLATDGTFVYMAYALAGVGSYSITAAGAITRHALDNPGKPTCVCSDGRRIWVGSNAGGVAVYDVNADGTLIQGPIDATENFVDAVASCGILLFAASTNGLCVYRAGPGYYAEEHLTGEFWTDGRPIYRQIAYFGAGPNAGAVSVDVTHGATFHEMIACTLCADDGGGAGARLVRADGFADIDSYVNAGDGKLYLEAPGNHAGDAFSVILEYTLD